LRRELQELTLKRTWELLWMMERA